MVPRRKPTTRGGGGKTRYADRAEHADAVSSELAEAIDGRSEPPFGIDPRAILVLELNRAIADEVWEGVDIRELDGRDLRATVAFSNRVDLSAFLQRLSTYREATASEGGHVAGADLFDRIDRVRFYGPDDRVTRRLSAALDESGDGHLLNIDIEVWHPGDASFAQTANQWLQIVRGALEFAEAAVLDSYVSHEEGVVLLRVRASVAAVRALSKVDEIASLDLKPSAPDVLQRLDTLTTQDLPDITPPGNDAPLFAVIDSGVAGAHPLISPALYEATTLVPALVDGADQHGHGTAVAGLALHGPAEQWLHVDVLAPFARLLSIRVLDPTNAFPDERLWVNAVLDAVDHAAERGCRIINLSIGDSDGGIIDRRATRLAALLDARARERGLVIVVPTGNLSDVREYVEPSADAASEYVRASATSAVTGLIDPAPAALALTVGGLGADGILRLGERALGGEGDPSALTRRGPGIARGLKPEFSAPAGTVAWVDTLGFVARRPLQPILLSHEADELFTRSMGTSFAAPIVTRVATAVQATYPDATSPLLRALVLQAVEPTELNASLLPNGTDGARLRSRLSFVGHGQPTIDSARFSERGRVVLVAEDELEVDQVIVYEVPLPEVFFESGGTRTIDLAVCFDPLTRYRRKDYLGSRFYPYLFIGHTAEQIVDVLSEADVDELAHDAAPQDDDAPTDVTTPVGTQPSGLSSLTRVDFKPSTAMSSDSANILMRAQRKRRFNPEREHTAHLAIRSVARWSPLGTTDPFGIALALGHSNAEIDLYAELRARVEVDVELELEV